jgi:6,7-dimethyl-8-ribityllumazine synthase
MSSQSRSPRLAVVVSRFNRTVTDNLLEGAMEAAERNGVVCSPQDVFEVPGAFELPVVAAAAAARSRYDAVVCLGAVIRGETPHFARRPWTPASRSGSA